MSASATADIENVSVLLRVETLHFICGADYIFHRNSEINRSNQSHNTLAKWSKDLNQTSRLLDFRLLDFRLLDFRLLDFRLWLVNQDKAARWPKNLRKENKEITKRNIQVEDDFKDKTDTESEN